MKKRTLLLIAAMVAFLPYSCEKEEGPGKEPAENTGPQTEPEPEPGPSQETQKFLANGKAEAGVDFSWPLDGAISLFPASSSVNTRAEMLVGQDPSVACFCVEDASTFAGTDDYIALYPYQEGASWAEGVLTFEFPAIQTGSFGGLCVAKASGVARGEVEFEFKNLYSILSVPVKGKGQTVKALELRGNNNEIVAGRCGVSDFRSPFTAMNLMGGLEKLTLNLASPVEVGATETVFKMAVPCITFSKGVTIRVVTADEADSEEFELSSVGSFNSPLTRSAEYTVPTLTFTAGALEWSTGCLIIDEKGYRFSDTDSANPTEPFGMLFQFGASCGIIEQMDNATPGSDIVASGARVMTLNADTGKWQESTVSNWLNHGALTQGDLCEKVPVVPGEEKWRLPTEEEVREWILVSSNNSYTPQGFANALTYAVYQTGDQLIKVFPTNYTVSKGTVQSPDWAGFWLQPDEDYLEKEKAKFVLFKPAAKFNSSNPNFTTCESTSYKIVPASNGLYRTPAMQYRCCRKKH